MGNTFWKISTNSSLRENINFETQILVEGDEKNLVHANNKEDQINNFLKLFRNG